MSQAYTGPERRKRPRTADDSIKETFESIVIAFILAFVFRAYVVEAFVIPTGSMAPTLLGEHLRLTCAQCGYEFTADPEERMRTEGNARNGRVRPHLTVDWHAICPMCFFPNPINRGMRISYGDRILVHKYIYSVSEPRRWDVVVFKNPTEPQVNFIKRMVGLPEEELQIIEGNVYVRPLSDPDDTGGGRWRIARKTDTEANPQAFKIQRTVFQPIYHSQYVPVDVTTSRPTAVRVRFPWSVPWVVAAGDEADWNLAGRGGYRHTSAGSGAIRFDFDTFYNPQLGLYVYNQFKSVNVEPIEDIRLAARVEPEGPLTLSLSTTARLDDPVGRVHRLTATINARGQASLERMDLQSTRRTVLGKPVTIEPLAGGQSRRVELWYVDQEASLWVDGKRVLVERFDLDMASIRRRAEPPHRPQVMIETAGAAATFYEVELDRDLYYSSRLAGDRSVGRGALVKDAVQPMGEPMALGADQFFVLGDNSPASSDSRYWDAVEPWIQYRMFEGQPIYGVVPRKLLMGRAFFVYWPAPWRLAPDSRAFIPNFSDMRFIK